MLDTGWFSFGGISSASLTNKLIVSKAPSLARSQRKIDVFSVPGRDGDIIMQQDAWENQTQTYECYVGNGDAPAAASELASWLFSLDGYQELKDSWETDVYRLAYLSEPLDIESIMSQVGRVDVTFSCVPRRYLNSGKTPVTITQSTNLSNPTAFTAKPLLLVSNAGGIINGTVACGGNTLSISANTSQVYVDCETQQTYSTNGTTWYNDAVTGKYPVIPKGAQRFAISGGISSVVVTPRWFKR